MRIANIKLTNFKKYAEQSFDLHPNFTLFIGDNGSGKTTMLDALAVAMGVWLAKPPTKGLVNSGRRIVQSEVRLSGQLVGDRVQFTEHRPIVVQAAGSLGGQEGLEWTRKVAGSDPSTNNSEAREALAIIQKLYSADGGADRPTLPLLAYYGAGRAWMASRQRSEKATLARRQPTRFDAYYDCLNERIRLPDLDEWFLLEMAEAGRHGGKPRPGFEVVRRAVKQCIPGCDLVDFSSDRREITVRINGALLPFSNLSAGQRMMVALIADLAIRAVTVNAQLLPAEALGPEDDPLPRVLRETPGVVLIDELDVHLHPKWQRRVATDLKRTFPNVQFVCTSHSPQVIGEVRREEIRVLSEDDVERPKLPPQSKGMDSNWILEVVQRADERDPEVKRRIKTLFERLARKELTEAESDILQLRGEFGNTGDVQRAASQLERLKLLNR